MLSPNNRKVTGGLPGLTPDKRSKKELREHSRWFATQALLKELEHEQIAMAPDGDVDTSDFQAQLGRVQSGPQFREKLKKLNPAFHFETSQAYPNLTGVYLLGQFKSEGIPVDKQHVCGMETGYMPEFSVRHWKWEERAHPTDMTFVKAKKPTELTRGWRSVLAVCIRRGLIEPERTAKLFEISYGRSSQQWQALTA